MTFTNEDVTYENVVLKQLTEGCIVPTSHKLNHDGYFRKRINNKLVMFHRYVYECQHGDIPRGYEVDHICRNRACCNPNHLQLLTISDHKVKTNTERSEERIAQAEKVWLESGRKITGTELASIFDVTISNGCRWVRRFKKKHIKVI
jgi:hypothetical protein